MTRLRWLTVENRANAAAVVAYRDIQGCTMMGAKKAVQNRVGPVLQIWEDPSCGGGGWTDVPHVTQYRGES